MKNKYTYITLLAIPFLLLVYSAIMRYAEGPFYLNTLYDPCYVYLVNSLNLAQFISPAHFDHPGTPVQLIGALVIKITHLFNNKTGNISADVLSDPEYYLSIIHITLAVINCIILFISSVIIYKATNNIYVSLLLQLSPFISYMVSYELSVVTAETFMIPVIMLLIAYSIKFIYSGKRSETGFVIIFAVFCGLGMAAKITFAPLVIIPLVLLNGYKNKLKFSLFTCFSFMIFFLPSISNFNFFGSWVKNLFIFDGLYGKGNPDIIDIQTFLIHLRNIFSENLIFFIIFLLIFLTLMITFQKLKKSGKNDQIRSESKLLLAIFLSMLLQIIIVAKHYSGHYIVPAVMLSVTGLFLCIRLYSDTGFVFAGKTVSNNIYISIIVIIFFITSADTVINYQQQNTLKENAFATMNFAEDVSEKGILISSYGSSSKSYALAFSTNWAGKNTEKYKNIIHDLYPKDLYYDFWDNRIYSVSEAKSLIKNFPDDLKIYFQNKYTESNEKIIEDLQKNYNFRNYTISNIYNSDNGEKIFEICHKK
ncbi:MAG TPA: hypothetical protein PKA90_15085 [Ignavibacteria bacterium]|nr:hypothetical protein [Ignavibacteria bacterium]